MTVLPFAQPQPTRFDEFWKVWKILDRNIDKADCRDLYTKIINGGLEVQYKDADGIMTSGWRQATEDEIIEGATAFKKRMIATETETKYIVHPIRWLKRGRWEDYE